MALGPHELIAGSCKEAKSRAVTELASPALELPRGCIAHQGWPAASAETHSPGSAPPTQFQPYDSCSKAAQALYASGHSRRSVRRAVPLHDDSPTRAWQTWRELRRALGEAMQPRR